MGVRVWLLCMEREMVTEEDGVDFRMCLCGKVAQGSKEEQGRAAGRHMMQVRRQDFLLLSPAKLTTMDTGS